MKNNYKNILVKVTFYITFAFLVTTGTITFIEAVSTSNRFVRHALNLETCISIVAGYYYGQFLKKIDVDEGDLSTLDDSKIDFKSINQFRYVDWAITTPIMLLVLLIVFGINTANMMPSIGFFAVILLINYLMLLFGFLNDSREKKNIWYQILGFISFFLLFGIIGMKYIWITAPILANNVIYYIYFFLWIFYGIFHLLKDEKIKNIGYNILDLFSKCFVGIFFWAYLTGAIKFLGN